MCVQNCFHSQYLQVSKRVNGFPLTNCQGVSVYSAAGGEVYAIPEALSPGAGTLSAFITEWGLSA